MISLDENILDPRSRVAARMGLYGVTQELHILIPNRLACHRSLSDRVSVEGTGGGKTRQFIRLLRRGRQLIRENQVDEITAQDPFFTGLVGFLLIVGKKILLEVQLHGDFYGSDYYKKGTIKQRIQYVLGRYILEKADRIRVPGERVRQSMLRLGVAAAKIVVQPVWVDTERLRSLLPRTDIHGRYPQFEKLFLVLSRFDPVKNIPWVIGVFANVVKARPRYGLVIVGEGGEKKKIHDTIVRHHLEHTVVLEPWTHDPLEDIKTADGLLFPSLSEGYGLVVMEAVALGTPVIMTDVGVAGYEAPRGPKVTIVPIGDKEAFYSGILAQSSI